MKYALSLLVVVGALACVSARLSAPTPPELDPVFNVPINATITTATGERWSWLKVWQYDSTTKPYGSALQTNSAGQKDFVCTAGRPSYTGGCTVLTASNGARYNTYEDGMCCKFCTLDTLGSGCTLLSRDWLSGAQYLGVHDVGGYQCALWTKTGNNANFMAFTNDADQKPCEFYQGYPTFAKGTETWLYYTDSYSTSPAPAGTFDIPNDCDTMCPGAPGAH